MIIGVLTLELHLPESNSLKSKRIIIKSLKDRIKNKFNVSIAEIDGNDLWQRCVLGAACVAKLVVSIKTKSYQLKPLPNILRECIPINDQHGSKI
jgi:uncharacterized protein YlxP (DUF503 family)